MSSYSLWAWAELEQVCTAESVATLDILWRYFYLPKRTLEHAARFLERIDRRLFNAASSTTVGQQAAAGINMLLAPAAKRSNLHDPVFPLLLQEFTSHAGLQAELARSELRPTELQNLDMERVPGIQKATHVQWHEHCLCDFAKVCSPKGRQKRTGRTSADQYLAWSSVVHPVFSRSDG